MKRSPCRQRHRFLEPIHNVKDGGEPPVRGRSREDLVFIPGNALAARSGDGVGGASRDRTDDLKLAKLALSQLSYGPERSGALQERRFECSKPGPSQRMKYVVGLGRFELPTSRLSSARSNQLSYKPPVAVSSADRRANGPSSSMEKEKRRRRCPAYGPHRS